MICDHIVCCSLQPAGPAFCLEAVHVQARGVSCQSARTIRPIGNPLEVVGDCSNCSRLLNVVKCMKNPDHRLCPVCMVLCTA